jgi:lysophospholipase L1-like esterase
MVLFFRMSRNYFARSVLIILLGSSLGRGAAAQQPAGVTQQPAAVSPVDSSFHNYLYDNRTAYFKQLPVVKKSILFFGDSITQWGDWAEFLGFRRVLNRGIAGDNTFGLAARVDEVIRHRPEKLFILAGTNDINLKIPVAYIIRNYRKIIGEVRRQSPDTKIFVQSVFPVNDELIGRQYYKGTNEEIRVLNGALQEMAVSQKVDYVNVYDHLLDGAGAGLDAKFTYDGLHLSGLGYQAWVRVLLEKKLL